MKNLQWKFWLAIVCLCDYDVEAISFENELVSMYYSRVWNIKNELDIAHTHTVFLLHFQTPFDSLDRIYFQTNAMDTHT